MKRLFVSLSFAVLASGSAFAQHDTGRVDAARFAEDQNRQFRGDSEFRDDRDFAKNNARTGWEIDRLNRDVRQLRYELRGVRSYRIRARFERLTQETDRLTALYRRNRMRGWEVRRRAENLRADAQQIRAMLRLR